MSIKLAHTKLVDHLKSLRVFDHVGESEPSQAPGKGLYAALWYDDIHPVPPVSGLDAVSMVYIFNVRMYRAATSTPADSIDPDLVAALDAVLASVIKDHTLGGTAFSVDVLAAYSEGISAETDYVDFGRDTWYRVVDLTLPVVIEGAYPYD